MIAINVEFYDRNTDFMIDEIRVEVPDDIVFRSAETTAIDEINAFMFDISEELKNYILEKYPHLNEKFLLYNADFSGKHKLGPEHD